MLEESVEEQATTPGASVRSKRNVNSLGRRRGATGPDGGPLVSTKRQRFGLPADAMDGRHRYIGGIIFGAHDCPLVLVRPCSGTRPVRPAVRPCRSVAPGSTAFSVRRDRASSETSSRPCSRIRRSTLGRFDLDRDARTIAFVSVCRPDTAAFNPHPDAPRRPGQKPAQSLAAGTAPIAARLTVRRRPCRLIGPPPSEPADPRSPDACSGWSSPTPPQTAARSVRRVRSKDRPRPIDRRLTPAHRTLPTTAARVANRAH